MDHGGGEEHVCWICVKSVWFTHGHFFKKMYEGMYGNVQKNSPENIQTSLLFLVCIYEKILVSACFQESGQRI